MRLGLTVLGLTVLGPAGERSDVLLRADENASVADVAVALDLAVRSHGERRRAAFRTGAGSARPLGRRREGRLAVVIPLPDPSAPDARSARATSPPTGTLWRDGVPLDPQDRALDRLGDGAVVALDPSAAGATAGSEPRGAVEVRVVAGPGAGPVHRLPLGSARVGHAPDCAVVLSDAAAAEHAATLEVAPEGVRVDPAPGATVRLEGRRLDGPASWTGGDYLWVGETALALALPQAPDLDLSPDHMGGLVVHRPPRLAPPPSKRRLVVPQRPARPEGPRLPLLAALLPLLAGVGLYAATRQVSFLLFTLMTPILMLGGWLSETRFGRRRYRRELAAYEQRRAVHEAELAEASRLDRDERRAGMPDPAAVLLMATGPRRRLWERRPEDPDVLALRLGVATLPAHVELLPATGAAGAQDPLPEPPQLDGVPVCVPLAQLGVLGLAGDLHASRALAGWLVAQAACLHGPDDLDVVVLAPGADAGAAWEWVRWLPHTRIDPGSHSPHGAADAVALVGAEAETVSRRVGELVAVLEDRRRTAATPGADPPQRSTLLILDGARALRRVPGVAQLLADGPRVGIVAVCLDSDERSLPEECRTVATWSRGVPVSLQLRGGGLEALGQVCADQVSAAWCERVARALAPLRDPGRSDAAALPRSGRLLDLVGSEPTATTVAAGWAAGGATTNVPMGWSADGPYHLDLRRDGPHALVAGTTGAGKSELLQTLLASLALANRPDALTFVLIDYKGGSAFKDCARLPHTVGMVTDLDGRLTERALASLSAELRRREEGLQEAGAKDLEDYEELRASQPQLPAVPRLVLVIDEFASLVSELPDFVTGLVAIAQRGRSLGVHLVLATQRPAGVVSADIRANTNLRIALRVTDAAESVDVIDAPDASAIERSTPGRCYVRSGAASLVAVQTARVGGRRPAPPGRGAPAVAAVVDWRGLGLPAPLPQDAVPAEEVTDLALLVDAVRAAADLARVAPQRSPWLAPLPVSVTVDELVRTRPGQPAPVRDGELAPVALGLVDLPAEQSREPFALDLLRGGHLLVAGSARSGRSTLLRTLAGSLARDTGPADAHLYAIDCGANALLPLVALPHCGAVVTRDQPERVDRLLGRLLAEVARRQQLLAETGTASVAEQRVSAQHPQDRLPMMVLLLDRWEGFVSAFEHYDLGRLLDSVLRLLREGPAVGLRAVVSSDRSGMVGQISALFEDRLVLRFADPGDYALAGIPARQVPRELAPGRGLWLSSRGLLEVQGALLDGDGAGTAQVAALQAIARHARARWSTPARHQRALRVDALPARVTSREAAALDQALLPSAGQAPLWALIGAGGDELGPLGVDLAEVSGFVVSGSPRSGRSTALATMSRSLLERGTPLLLVTPRRSPLQELAQHPGVLAALDEHAPAERLRQAIAGRARYVLVIDDAELLIDAAITPALEETVRAARDGEHGVALAGTGEDLAGQYRGFVVDARRARAGLLLAPSAPSDGDVLGVRLPRGVSANAAGPPGRGLLVVGGYSTPLQVALADG